MAFDFGSFLSQLGHNFAANANGGGGMPGQPQDMNSKLMQTAQILKGQPTGQPGQMGQMGQGMGGGGLAPLMQILQRFGGGQPPAQPPMQAPAPTPNLPPLQAAGQVVQQDLGQQSGLPLADPTMTPRPNFGQMFARFGGQY